jgi:hypothetical protein
MAHAPKPIAETRIFVLPRLLDSMTGTLAP